MLYVEEDYGKQEEIYIVGGSTDGPNSFGKYLGNN